MTQDQFSKKAFELGFAYEGKYGACSQCTILAIMDTIRKRDEAVFKSAFGFAGGIGSLSETCGAFLAGVMFISLEYGRSLENLSTQTEEERHDCMQMIRDLHLRLIEEYGSIKCAEIHQKIFGRSFNQWDSQEFLEFLRLGGHLDKCTLVVGNCAQWTVELLQTKSSTKRR